MIDSSELTPILIESMFTLLENFFSVLVSALNPVMIPILFSIIAIAIIKRLISRVIDFVYIGYPQREIRHKKAMASNAVDFLSALSDIFPKSKDK